MDPERNSTSSRLAIHELRHDLARARALAEQVLDGLGEDSEVVRPARSLRALLDRAKHALEGVSLGDADVAVRQPTQVAPLIEAVIDAHDPERRRVAWRGASLIANVDPVKVERIVDNLLENALEHAPPDTTVQVVSEGARRAVLVTIEHDGTPVPPRVRERLDDDRPVDARAPTGLEVVARFVRAHGGGLHIDPARARVQVELPLSAAGPHHS